MGINKSKNLGMMILTIAAVIFLFFIWPTPYKYDHLKSVPVRINRLTGKAWMLSYSGWVIMDSEPALPIPVAVELPDAEIKKIVTL